MKPIRVPLAFDIESRTNSYLKDARIVNAYVDTQGSRKWVIKRPGLSSAMVSPALSGGAGSGMFIFNNKLYIGINFNLYEIVPAGQSITSSAGSKAVNGRVLNGSKWVHGSSDINTGTLG